MRRLPFILVSTLLLLLVSAGSAFAQSYTSVTSTVKDPFGTVYALGSYTISLTNTSGQQPQFGGNPSFQQDYAGSLDANGSLSITLPSSAVITPAGTQWAFNICANPGQVAAVFPRPVLPCFVSNQTISGTSQAVTFTAAVIPLPKGPNGVVSGSGTVSRAVSGATDTILSSDCVQGHVTYTGSTAVAVTLPTGTTLGASNCSFVLVNNTTGAGNAITVTPTTWTLTGSGSQGIIVPNEQAIFTVDPSGNKWEVDLVPVNPVTGQATLPCTQFSGADIGAQCTTLLGILNSLGLTGTLIIPTGTYNGVTHNIDTSGLGSGAKYSIQCGDGTNPEATIINYTGTGDFIKYSQTALNVYVSGSVSGCHINGTASGVSGIHFIDTINFHVHDVTVTGFTGAGAAGIWQDNVTLYTEDFELSHSALYGNTNQWKLTNTGGLITTYSFTDTHAWDVYMTASVAGQKCFDLESGAMFGGNLSMRCVLIINSGGGGTIFNLAGLQYTGGPGATMQGVSLQYESENDGSVAATGLICPSGNSLLYNGVFSEIGTVGTITDSINGACTVHADMPFHFLSGASAAQNSRWTIDVTNGFLFPTTDGVTGIGEPGGVPLAIRSYDYYTGTNCQLGGAAGTASPAACTTATAGHIAIPISLATYTINTSQVTNNSEIFVRQITDNAGLPSGPTCNATATNPLQSSRSAGASFTFTLTSTANVTCYAWWIINQ